LSEGSHSSHYKPGSMYSNCVDQRAVFHRSRLLCAVLILSDELSVVYIGPVLQTKANSRLVTGAIAFIWVAVPAFQISVACLSTDLTLPYRTSPYPYLILPHLTYLTFDGSRPSCCLRRPRLAQLLHFISPTLRYLRRCRGHHFLSKDLP